MMAQVSLETTTRTPTRTPSNTTTIEHHALLSLNVTQGRKEGKEELKNGSDGEEKWEGKEEEG